VSADSRRRRASFECTAALKQGHGGHSTTLTAVCAHRAYALDVYAQVLCTCALALSRLSPRALSALLLMPHPLAAPQP
jgi:hypothetical protein